MRRLIIDQQQIRFGATATALNTDTALGLSPADADEIEIRQIEVTDLAATGILSFNGAEQVRIGGSGADHTINAPPVTVRGGERTRGYKFQTSGTSAWLFTAYKLCVLALALACSTAKAERIMRGYATPTELTNSTAGAPNGTVAYVVSTATWYVKTAGTWGVLSDNRYSLAMPAARYSAKGSGAIVLTPTADMPAIGGTCSGAAINLASGHYAVGCTTTAATNNEQNLYGQSVRITGASSGTGQTAIRAASLVSLSAVSAAERSWPIVITSGTTIGNSDDPALSYAGIRYSTNAGDSQWKCCSNDGTSTGSCVALGARNAGVVPLRFEVSYIEGVVSCRIIDGVSGLLLSSVSKTDQLPANSTALSVYSGVTTLQNVALSTRIAYLGIE